MAECMAAEILIGGRIPADVALQLCGAIRDADVGLEYGEYGFSPDSPDDLLSSRSQSEGPNVLILHDHEARWGEFRSLEDFLQENGIPYDRFSEAKYEYCSQTVHFRPGQQPVALETNAERQPIVTASGLAEVQKSLATAIGQLQRGDHAALCVLEAIQARLRDLLPPEVPPLESLEIINPGPAEVTTVGAADR